MVPKVSLDGTVAEVLRRVSVEADQLRWSCPKCGIERGVPLKAADIEAVKDYVRKQKKQWWQFWI
jgi:hypothetical protein